MKKNGNRERVLALIVLLLLLLLPLPALLYARPQEMPIIGSYQCPFLYWTGLPCAGCGMTRAFFALFHGRIGEAFRENALFLLPLGFWLYLVRGCILTVFTTRRPQFVLLRYLVPAIVLAIIGFWLIRLVTV